MAFVKLPPSLRSLELRRRDGRSARVDFSVFAGAVAEVRRLGRGPAVRVTLRSPRQEQSFEFAELPIDLEPGVVAAVVAAIPADAQTGPILACADVENDRRVDFLHREAEALALFVGETKDMRAWRPGFGLLAGALAKGAVLGAIAYPLAAIGFGALPPRLSPPAFDDAAGWLELVAVLRDGALAGAPAAVVGAAIAGLGVLHFLLRGWLSKRSRARDQRATLEALWAHAGAALGFVQDNAAAFREPMRRPDREAAVARAGQGLEPRRGARQPAEPPAFLRENGRGEPRTGRDRDLRPRDAY